MFSVERVSGQHLHSYVATRFLVWAPRLVSLDFACASSRNLPKSFKLDSLHIGSGVEIHSTRLLFGYILPSEELGFAKSREH